jgi:putative transposase
VRKSRFNEQQIIGILKESEAGVPTPELCRKHGIASQTLYRTKPLEYSGHRSCICRYSD